MRISDWATKFNVSVKPSEQRPDNPAGDVVYRIKDVFTTRDGSWDPSNQPGAIAQWARDLYLRAHNAPDLFDDGGGDHHLFARVLDEAGRPIVDSNLVRHWSDGFHKLGDSAYQGYVHMTPKERSGWSNLVIWNSFVPERGEIGAWCWCPEGAADVVVGGGMPANMHVSTFAVWQAEPRQTVVEPRVDPNTPLDPNTPPSGGGNEPISPELITFEQLRREAWRLSSINFNRDSTFANYARMNNLGAPLTNEYDIGQFRAQGFCGGIVYAPIGQWNNIVHMGW